MYASAQALGYSVGGTCVCSGATCGCAYCHLWPPRHPLGTPIQPRFRAMHTHPDSYTHTYTLPGLPGDTLTPHWPDLCLVLKIAFLSVPCEETMQPPAPPAMGYEGCGVQNPTLQRLLWRQQQKIN